MIVCSKAEYEAAAREKRQPEGISVARHLIWELQRSQVPIAVRTSRRERTHPGRCFWPVVVVRFAGYPRHAVHGVLLASAESEKIRAVLCSSPYRLLLGDAVSITCCN